MVGFGFIGRVHAHAHLSLPLFYHPLPLRTHLIGVCTSSSQSGERACRQAGFNFHTCSIDELISHPDIDIVHICTPNAQHFEAVRAALNAKKHIYCEKPLALNSAEAETLASLSTTTPTVHQMTFHNRFVPAMMRARELAEGGFPGKLLGFRAAYLHAGYVNPDRPHSWRLSKALSGGGALADLGSHAIDLVRYLTGPSLPLQAAGEWQSVAASLQTIVAQRPHPATGEPLPVDVDDIALVQAKLQGGAMGTLEASRMATGTQDELRLEIHGTEGAMRFNLMDPNWLDVYHATLPEAPLGGDRGFTRLECVTRYPSPYALGATKNSVGWINFHIHSLFDFVQNIARLEEGKPLLTQSPTLQDGLAVQRIMDACLQSAGKNGVWQDVQNDLHN